MKTTIISGHAVLKPKAASAAAAAAPCSAAPAPAAGPPPGPLPPLLPPLQSQPDYASSGERGALWTTGPPTDTLQVNH